MFNGVWEQPSLYCKELGREVPLKWVKRECKGNRGNGIKFSIVWPERKANKVGS